MEKRGFLEKQGIVRNAIREDMLFFAVPAILVFFAGMVVSATLGRSGLVIILWGLVKRPIYLPQLSIYNILGLGLFAVGIAIQLVAYFTLRRFYSSTLIIREDHKLITHGIYSLIRHPIYFGVILAAIGIPISSSSPYGFFIMLALIPIFLIRIRFEERILIDEFGDAYQIYQGITRRLIPFIY